MENIHKKLQNLSILIVEDDISTLKWLSRILAIYFKEVYTAEDAMKALEIFNNKSFDVVISDIEMPHVDGLHLLQKIALIKNSTIRAVMTAFNSPEYMNRVIESDVHFYFKKPIDIDELLVAISSKLTKQNSKDKKISLGEEFLYDYKQKNISKDNLEISLTKKEIQLLEYLINNKNSIVSIEQLENSVWQETVSADAVRMVVTNLRKKTYSKLIKNIKGIGYKINNL